MAEPKKPVDPQKEIEILIGELEERVDRLRAMYEQYFMGYEKIEPGVARKDVDRRFIVLRKTQIRNTALRFRFNVVTQKMNTYSMYWTRICRQIEEGTFKRHIQKANKRFQGTGRREQDFSIDVELGDFEDMMDEDGDLDMDKVLADGDSARNARPTEPPEHDETKQSALGYERDDTAKNKFEQKLASLISEVPPKSVPKPAHAPYVLPETDTADTLPPPSTGSQRDLRVARHAVLPTGLKQRVLVKKGPATQPQPSSSSPTTSTKTEPAPPSAAEMTPAPMTAPGMRPRLPSAPDRAPPSTSVIRAASSAQGHVHRSPPGVVRPGISPNAQSVQRVQVAKRQPDTQPPPPSVSRAPVAQPAPSVNRAPAAQPAPPSTNRIPAAPSGPRLPIGLPSGGSVGRMPVSAGTIPPPTAQPATPHVTRPAAPAPSERKLPIPARPGGPMPTAAPVRAPAPSVPDVEKGGPPSRRPPPMLPSQVKKS